MIIKVGLELILKRDLLDPKNDFVFKRIYEMRQKALHDEASLREGAREEGEKLGELKGKLEVAAKMLAKGMDIGSVAELTGLPMEELKQLNQAH